MLKPGDILDGRYEIEDRIGQGGMSYVYRAHDNKLGRTVAIKVLKEEFSGDEEFIKKFRNEAMAAAKLSHPNIVAAYDAVDEGELHYIIMELVEGITLKNYIARKGRLSNRETLGIALQAAEGIAEAHKKGIIHRDIKPQNMIISKDGKVKVADFGIAKAVSGETLNMSVLGSVHYISPEQAKEGKADTRSDIYSLGISMYEMITGRLPYEGDNTVNVVMAHISETMVPPSVYNKEIYPALCDIIMKATKKDPNERYQSMQELITDLKRCAKDPNGHFVRLYDTVYAEGDGKAAAKQAGRETAEAVRTNSGAVEKSVAENGASMRAEEENVHFSAHTGSENAERGTNARAEAGTSSQSETDAGSRQYDSNGRSMAGGSSDSSKSRETAADEDQLRAERTSDSEASENAAEDDSAERIRQFMKFGAVGAGILVLLILALIGGRITGLFRAFSDETPAETVTAQTTAAQTEESEINFTIPIQGGQLMPDLTGMTEDAARAKLKELQLSMDSSKTEYSDIYMEGRIIDQSPKDGESVTPGETVYVTISRGTQIEAALKAIVGKTESEAKEMLKEVDVTVSDPPQFAFSEDVTKNHVTGWELVAEDEQDVTGEVKKGSKVVLILSSGRESDSVRVPLLRGMTPDAAASLLEQLGLKLGAKTEASSADIPSGLIAEQSLEANTEAARGTAIDITVSTGNEAAGSDSAQPAAGTAESQGPGAGNGSQSSSEAQYYYGRIDTTCQIGTASGPDAASRQIMVYIGLSQRVDGATDFTVLEDPKPVSAGSKIPVTFNAIRGAYGVTSGEIQVLDAETNEIYGRFSVSFSPREGSNG